MHPSSPIPQRDIHFSIDGCDMRRWCNDDPCRTHFFSAMSIMFPEGEKFFIDSVRHYRDRVTDPKLQADVAGFIGQEAMHGREHRAYNTALTRAGYDVAALERRTLRQIAFTQKMLPAFAHVFSIKGRSTARDYTNGISAGMGGRLCIPQ